MVALALPFPTASTAALTALSPTRRWLSPTAFVDHQRALVDGTEALFETLRNQVTWQAKRRTMYDRVVDVPRLLGGFGGDVPPLIRTLQEQPNARYSVVLNRLSLARYRDGNDSVAWHGDRIGIHRPWSIVAILSVGGPRRFLMRPSGGGKSFCVNVGTGDLVVMGGDVQETWEHCIPKTTAAYPRIAVMFRHSSMWTGEV